MNVEYKLIEHFQPKEFTTLLNEAAKEGWVPIHFNSIYARLGEDHRDHHTQFHVILKRLTD
ncbi:hypothetical protein LCGC14_2342760 [marine sediment metagenome]|uniref:DUF4177 domain-containing protein n=1 Tax=marine sediment metagenome TaxID=412755 RepID=A0A0F9CBD6_9ZZZZ